MAKRIISSLLSAIFFLLIPSLAQGNDYLDEIASHDVIVIAINPDIGDRSNYAIVDILKGSIDKNILNFLKLSPKIEVNHGTGVNIFWYNNGRDKKFGLVAVRKNLIVIEDIKKPKIRFNLRDLYEKLELDHDNHIFPSFINPIQ